MIKCLLTELGRAGRENIWPSVMAHGLRCARSVRHDLGPNIFPSGPPTQSISTCYILWSGGISDFDANFGSILSILSPKPGEWSKSRKNNPKANLLFKGCLVYPSFWPSFIEIGVMACITPAWSSHEVHIFLNIKTKLTANCERGRRKRGSD